MHVSLFRADSGTILIKQEKNVKGRPSDSAAQLAECSHGKREALGSSPGRATIFASPVTSVRQFRKGTCLEIVTRALKVLRQAFPSSKNVINFSLCTFICNYF